MRRACSALRGRKQGAFQHSLYVSGPLKYSLLWSFCDSVSSGACQLFSSLLGRMHSKGVEEWEEGVSVWLAEGRTCYVWGNFLFSSKGLLKNSGWWIDKWVQLLFWEDVFLFLALWNTNSPLRQAPSCGYPLCPQRCHLYPQGCSAPEKARVASLSKRPQRPQTPACAARKPDCCRTRPSGCRREAPGPAPLTATEQHSAPSTRRSQLIGSWPVTRVRMSSGWTERRSSHLRGEDLAAAAQIEW